jgi:hypothetical protein
VSDTGLHQARATLAVIRSARLTLKAKSRAQDDELDSREPARKCGLFVFPDVTKNVYLEHVSPPRSIARPRQQPLRFKVGVGPFVETSSIVEPKVFHPCRLQRPVPTVLVTSARKGWPL